MKSVVTILAASSLLGLALDATAQTRPTDQPTGTTTTTTREAFRNTEGLMESRTLVGTRVKNAQGKDIGEIDQLLIDAKSGKVTHAVIGVGGMMGIGERHVVVPWSAITMAADPAGRADRPVVSMDQAALDRAPRWDRRASTDDRDAPSASPRGPASGPSGRPSPPPGTGPAPSTSPSGTTR